MWTHIILLVSCLLAVQPIPVDVQNQIYVVSKTSTLDEDIGTFRLPNNTRPLRYDIELTTHLHLGDNDPDKFAFDGRVLIHVQVLEISDYITLHAKDLTLQEATITNSRGEEVEFVDDEQPAINTDKDFVTYHVKDYLYPDEVITIEIVYNGTLRDDNTGFYRSSYLNRAGEKIWLASSQFAAADARHAFPCYDEPQRRAVYGLTIKAHSKYTAISNAPEKESNQ